MRKILILMLLILTLSSPVFCETTWFSPYSASFAVDLKNGTSNGNPVRGTDSGIYYDPESSNNDQNADYNELTNMVGTIGITNGGSSLTQGTYSVAFNFDNTDWTYISQSDRSLQIPFGIDIVIRYRVQHKQTGGWLWYPNEDEIADYTYKVGGKNFLEFGYGKDGKLVNETGKAEYYINTSEIDLDPENRFETEIGPAGNVVREFTNTLVGIWVDIILILQESPESKYEGMFQIGAANDYMTSFDVEVNGTNYPVVMTGVYGEGPYSGSGSVLFTVTPNANAYSLNISELLNSTEGIEIGTYYYTAEADTDGIQNEAGGTINSNPSREYIINNVPRDYAVFASASDDPVNGNGKNFVMMHDDVADNATLNPRNGFKFLVRIVSTAPGNDRIPNGNDAGLYDGTGVVGSVTPVDKALRYETMIGNTPTFNYYDQGRILITCYDGNKAINENLNLVEGSYSSTIYLHFISEK